MVRLVTAVVPICVVAAKLGANSDELRALTKLCTANHTRAVNLVLSKLRTIFGLSYFSKWISEVALSTLRAE